MKSPRRHFTRQIVVLAAVAVAGGLPRAAHAAGEITAAAALETASAVVGQPLRLLLSVKSVAGARRARPTLPAALEGDFEIVRSIPGRSMSASFGIPGGGSNSEFTHDLTIVPLKAGTYEMGFVVEVGGETVKSNVPVLTVTESVAPQADTVTTGSVPTVPKGDIFVWVSTDKATAYVGQQITYALDVYERRQFRNVHLRKPPTFADFFSEEPPQAETTITQVGGVAYRVESGVRRALFPQRAGTLTIGEAELSVGLRKRLKSVALTVEVLPLPAEGQPAKFSPNNVGSYTIEASVDRTSVDAGVPLTLTVTVTGSGNINFIDPGAWPQTPGLRRYDPKVDTTLRTGPVLGGVRSYEFLMVPEKSGTLTIPEHTLAYFDPDKAAYEVAKTNPIEITVAGQDIEGPAATDAAAEREAAEDQARLADVIGGDALPDVAPASRWLTTSRWTYGMLAVPALAAAGLGGAALARRFGPDERARARTRDKMRRQLRIQAAEAAVASGDGFHAMLSKLLHELAVRRAGVDGIGLPRPELLRLLEARQAKAVDLEELRELLDDCDAARFAAQTGSPDDRRGLLDRALALVGSSSLSKEGS
ncbi:MAG: protein BatD [Nannocystaceae bacterium]|nr:protein BatD [Nannocystaceae bacterium]